MSSRLTKLDLPAVGVTLQIRRIPYMLLDDWRRGLPEPPPVPTQEVDYGGKKVTEENSGHPGYVQAIQDHSFKIGMLAIEFAIDRGVVVDIDEAEVKELRDWTAAQIPPIPLPVSDKVVYVSRILVTDLADLIAVRAAVFGRIAPTQEQIDRAVEIFRSGLPGKTSVPLAGETEQGEL